MAQSRTGAMAAVVLTARLTGGIAGMNASLPTNPVFNETCHSGNDSCPLLSTRPPFLATGRLS